MKTTISHNGIVVFDGGAFDRRTVSRYFYLVANAIYLKWSWRILFKLPDAASNGCSVYSLCFECRKTKWLI